MVVPGAVLLLRPMRGGIGEGGLEEQEAVHPRGCPPSLCPPSPVSLPHSHPPPLPTTVPRDPSLCSAVKAPPPRTTPRPIPRHRPPAPSPSCADVGALCGADEGGGRGFGDGPGRRGDVLGACAPHQRPRSGHRVAGDLCSGAWRGQPQGHPLRTPTPPSSLASAAGRAESTAADGTRTRNVHTPHDRRGRSCGDVRGGGGGALLWAGRAPRRAWRGCVSGRGGLQRPLLGAGYIGCAVHVRAPGGRGHVQWSVSRAPAQQSKWGLWAMAGPREGALCRSIALSRIAMETVCGSCCWGAPPPRPGLHRRGAAGEVRFSLLGGSGGGR